jgi:hypothetical protein
MPLFFLSSDAASFSLLPRMPRRRAMPLPSPPFSCRYGYHEFAARFVAKHASSVSVFAVFAVRYATPEEALWRGEMIECRRDIATPMRDAAICAPIASCDAEDSH